MCHKYARYLHKTNITVFNILSTVTQTKFQLSGIIIAKDSLFNHVIYSSASLHSPSNEKFQLSGTIITEVGLFAYIIHSPDGLHCQQCGYSQIN